MPKGSDLTRSILHEFNGPRTEALDRSIGAMSALASTVLASVGRRLWWLPVIFVYTLATAQIAGEKRFVWSNPPE